MLACLAIIFIYSKYLEAHVAWLDKLPIVYIFETVALVAFGLSWLTKGQVDYLFLPRRVGLVKR